MSDVSALASDVGRSRKSKWAMDRTPGRVKLTKQQVVDMQDLMIAAYCTLDFQRRLHKTWDATNLEDEESIARARQNVCLPVQIPVVAKFGFEPTKQGVNMSVLASLAFKSDPDVIYRGQFLAYLVDPTLQRHDQFAGFADRAPELYSMVRDALARGTRWQGAEEEEEPLVHSGSSVPECAEASEAATMIVPSLVLLSGETVHVTPLNSETVGTLRARVADTLGRPPNAVRLAAGSAVLHNDQCVGDLGLEIIHVILRAVERRLYVAEAGCARVTCWRLDLEDGGPQQCGEIFREVVAGGQREGRRLEQLSNPRGVCVTGHGTVYVAESGNDRVSRWSPGCRSGELVAGGLGNGGDPEQIDTPTGLCIDAEGAVYVAEYWNHRVSRWPSTATRGECVAGGKGQGGAPDQLNCPTGLFVDPADGAIYVAEYWNHRVSRWQRGSKHCSIVAGGRGRGNLADQLDRPTGVFVDANGAIYVAEHHNHRVTCWARGAAHGEVVAGGRGRGAGMDQLDLPWGLFVDEEGAVYVAEEGNHRVTRWARGAKSGELVAGGCGEGDSSRQLSSPFGIFVVDTAPGAR
eukprot:gnl/TRDRNA2_/TRDRNA2_129055_c0_seq1.p1 gnl/TRDRNA2_/TRDRNA2_129055_c0~~gnl/TRDRNA2_/TRDRNA2_129055_c0_seq1.p1  ORF type:complete len:577 (-),score=78.54 gnl/TRDRNA2_/TRDRNA2_129055_c0_seq1:32-1762(-)